MTTESVNKGSKNIVEQIINLMTIVENSDKTGVDKKASVMKKIKDNLGTETYDRYSPLISMVIDAVVSISKNEIVLDELNKMVSKFCC